MIQNRQRSYKHRVNSFKLQITTDLIKERKYSTNLRIKHGEIKLYFSMNKVSIEKLITRRVKVS